jgi:MFS family permease
MIRTIYAVSSLLLGIGLLLMGLALLSTSMGVRAVTEGFPDAVTGIVMASYFGGFILGSYLCPRLVNRIGPIRAYATLAAIGSVCTFAHIVYVHPLAWSALRFVIGICMVGLYMVIESWLNRIAPNEKRGRIFAVYMIVTLAAHALGQFLLLLAPDAGTLTFSIAAAFFTLGLIPVAMTRLPEPPPVQAPTLHLRQLLSISPLSVAGALSGGLASSSFWALGAVFAQRIGLDTAGIVTFMVSMILGGTLLQWPIGKLSDRVDRRIVILAVAAVATGMAIVASLFARHSHVLLYISTFLLGGFIFPIYSLSVAYLNDRIHQDDVLQASRGILLLYGIGAMVGPAIAGLLMHLFGPIWLFFYDAIVLGAFTLFVLLRIQVTEAPAESQRSEYLPMTRTSQAALELDPRIDETAAD